MKEIKANLIDIFNKQIYPVKIKIQNTHIQHIEKLDESCDTYILPGFVDAHVHVESSMLVPSEFARLAVVHGTVGTISDPHEIANVLGVEGVKYMIANGKQVPFKFYFGAPSCVPATTFETAGAVISPEQIDELLQMPEITYLAEMMNFPGVLYEDKDVMAKIASAKKYGKQVDGHAPGLRGEMAKKYISAGITTDHECFTYDEAAEKLSYGMKILIREGSAAKNYEALSPLIEENYKNMMFCSDDKHPDNLVESHINQLVKRSLAKGYDLFKVLQMACINPVQHYSMQIGLLREGDFADFIEIDNLQDFNILKTFINGEMVAKEGESFIRQVAVSAPNAFNTDLKKSEEFAIPAQSDKIKVIEVIDGQLITQSFIANTKIVNGFAVADQENDILKITVVNRYSNQKPAVAFIKNFGLKNGAIASCVAHDSHNIVAVGTDDEYIAEAVNLVIEARGGISAVSKLGEMVLPLPVAGIMSDKDGYTVAEAYSAIDIFAKSMGCKLISPFMSLSFMALLVIPSLKLSDLGLFDGNTFQFTEVFEG